MTLTVVRTLCVENFPGSLTRSAIMENLEMIVRRLNREDIVGELWLDGSFLTVKIDPGDVDYVLRVSSSLYDWNTTKQAVIDWASHRDLKESHSCDAYKWVEYSSGHPMFAVSENDRVFWTNLFGKSHIGGVPKGIAVVSLPAELK